MAEPFAEMYTIQIPLDLAEQLRSAAEAEGEDVNNYTVARLQDFFETDEAEDEDRINALREGLAQAATGQLLRLWAF